MCNATKWVFIIFMIFALYINTTESVLADKKLDDKKNWWDDRIILSTFTSVMKGDDIEKIVPMLQEAGLNVIECNTPCEYSANDLTKEEVIRTLIASEKVGLKFILTDHKRLTGNREPSADAIKSMVDDYSSYKALAGYYIWDEPLPGDYPAVKKMYDAVRSLDPSRLAINPLVPNSRPEDVRQFVKEINPSVLSFDHYAVRYDKDDTENPIKAGDDVYRDLELWSSVSEETGKPLWMYVSTCQWFNVAKPTLAVLSSQVYTALAYGVKGIQYFESKVLTGGKVDFIDAPINPDGSKGSSFEAFKAINMDVNAKAPWLAKMKLVKLMHTAPVPPYTNAFKPGFMGLTGASDKLIVSFHKDRNSKNYMIVVNKDVNYAHDVYLQFSKKTSLVQISEMTQLSGKNNKISFTLAPGGGKLFELKQ